MAQQLIPVDPSSEVYKDLMAVDTANTQPQVAGTKKLVPVDPSAPEYKAIMTGQDLADRQEAARPGPQPNEARVQQVQRELQGGGGPRPMGAVSNINIDTKTGKASLQPATEASASGSYAPAAMVLGGGLGRVAQAVIGGGSAALEGGSPMEIAASAALPRVAEGVGQVGKAALRGASKFMSPSAMRTAGNAMQEGVKDIATPVATPTATRDALQQVGTSIRTPDTAKKALQEHVDKLTTRYAAGQPFSYGDFFEHMNQIGQKAHAFFESGTNQASGRALKTVQDAMAQDLAAIGPEAKIGTEAWKNAVGGVGGWSGAKKLWSALGASSVPGVGAIVAPVSGAVGGAGAVISALAGLMVRAPGVGQSLAKSLITPDGTVVKQALPALAQLMKERVKQNGND